MTQEEYLTANTYEIGRDVTEPLRTVLAEWLTKNGLVEAKESENAEYKIDCLGKDQTLSGVLIKRGKECEWSLGLRIDSFLKDIDQNQPELYFHENTKTITAFNGSANVEFSESQWEDQLQKLRGN
jgi:hypothetical protein